VVILRLPADTRAKLTAWKLAERGIPFIAAGRSQARGRGKAMEKGFPNSGDTITCASELPTKKRRPSPIYSKAERFVINIVGPFMQLGRAGGRRRGLAAGCHYFDTTRGKTDWMTLLKKQFGSAFAAKGLALCPGNSYMWAEGKLATEIALGGRRGIDTLDVVYLGGFRCERCLGDCHSCAMCTKPQYFLKNGGAGAMALGDLLFWCRFPASTYYFTRCPGAAEESRSGMKGIIGCANCQLLVSFRNQERFNAVIGLLKKFEAEWQASRFRRARAE